MEESKVTLIHIGIVLLHLHFESVSKVATEIIVVTPVEWPEAFDREVLLYELMNWDRAFFVELAQVVGVLA